MYDGYRGHAFKGIGLAWRASSNGQDIDIALDTERVAHAVYWGVRGQWHQHQGDEEICDKIYRR